MKSIRLKVIVYCLSLLAAAEGLAFWLVYRTAAASLAEKQEVYKSLLHEQHVKRIKEEKDRLDAELLETAREVALISSRQSQWEKIRFMGLFPLVNMASAQAHLTLPLLEITAVPSAPPRPQNPPAAGWWLRSRITTQLVSDVSLPEASLPRSPHGEKEYFQINSEWGRTWSTLRMPFSNADFAGSDLIPDWRHDDVTLSDGRRVRRIMYKTSINPMRVFGGRRVGPGPTGGPRGDRGQDRLPEQPSPQAWLVFHVAVEPARLNSTVSRLSAEMGDAEAQLERDASDALGALRGRMYAIGGLTLLATMAGGLLLVGLGFAPLKKLSEAVSQVSPKNFRLPLAEGESLGTELDPIADRLRNTLEELRRAFEREKQASADISHELRTPVASLLATLDVALRKPRTAEEYRRVLEDCRGVGRQMRVLVERLLALARIDAGSDRLRPCDVEVSELVGECAALVRPLATERGVKLTVDCPQEVTWATDPDKLREVIVNLLHNAVQYNKPEGQIDVSARANDGVLDVCVADTGVGIEPEKLSHIFERFYRADPSRTGSDLHAGLGLSIVKGYVGLLGGTISVESQAGRGSKFHVRLPAASLTG
ncbi:MAG: HAMP domain-containing sensor histidine kinase [Gemmataceae bacterium]